MANCSMDTDTVLTWVVLVYGVVACLYAVLESEPVERGLALCVVGVCAITVVVSFLFYPHLATIVASVFFYSFLGSLVLLGVLGSILCAYVYYDDTWGWKKQFRAA